MTQIAAHFAPAAASTRHPTSLFKACWDALLERRERQKVRAALYALSDRELADFAIARCDVEYVAANRNTDSRDV